MDKRISTFIKTLKEKQVTVAFAESVTCGLAAHKLSTCPGTSEVFVGSIVCYTEEVKKKLFGVSSKCIENFTCESMEVTQALAKKLPSLLQADVYAAVTGLASAGGSETYEKPVGTIFFCIYYKQKFYKKIRHFKGSPLTIRKKACIELYRFVLSKL
jgi:nicotinamide-nucleotide amidase